MRKKVLAVVLAVLAFSLIAASAASLGGITVNGEVGADTEVVASCDTDGVDVDFTTAFVGGSYVVDSVTVSGIHDDCIGSTLDITLLDGTDGVLYTSGGVVVDDGSSTDDNPMSFGALTVNASALTDVSILITS